MKASAVVPCALGGPSRRLRAVATTGVLALFLLGTPVLVALAVLRIVSNEAITGEGGLGLGRADVVPLLVALTAICTWLPGALVAVGEVRGRDRPVRSSRLVPSGTRRVVAARVEASLRGAGTLRGWTSTRVDASLNDLEAPVPRSPAEIASLVDAEHQVGVDGSDDGVRPPVEMPHGPSANPSLRRAGTTDYLVQRGDTWWGLANRFLGEGRRFADLKELNIGRSQPDGTILHPDAVLRAGWTIGVPKNEATE